MSGPIELLLTAKQFDQLVAVVHKTKPGMTRIAVNFEGLEKLLIDHARLLRAVPHREPEAQP
jgi:hypothetical protein